MIRSIRQVAALLHGWDPARQVIRRAYLCSRSLDSAKQNINTQLGRRPIVMKTATGSQSHKVKGQRSQTRTSPFSLTNSRSLSTASTNPFKNMVLPPLPPNPYIATPQVTLNEAYERCLSLEDRRDQVLQTGNVEVLVCARFLGRMILEAPDDKGRENFASEVKQCVGDEELQSLAQIYIHHIVCIFIMNHGRTNTARDNFPDLSSPITPQDEEQANRKALERDHHRCMFSGKLDYPSVTNGLTADDTHTPFTISEASYIFDILTNEDIEAANRGVIDDSSDIQRAYRASVIALLHQFGGIDTIEELSGPRLHRLENILTLSCEARLSFHPLKIWLESDPADPINHYKLCSVSERYLRGFGLPDVIRFTTPDAVALPLPDPRYLSLHAACARVVHLSGARKYIDKVCSDMEEIEHLLNDRAGPATHSSPDDSESDSYIEGYERAPYLHPASFRDLISKL